MTEDKQYTKAELLKKLTPKEKRFCHEYIIDWNASRSSRVAGYSENTCAEIGCQNLTKLHIRQYIDFIKHDYELESGISKVRQLKELSKLAYASIELIHDDWIDLKSWEDIKKDNPEILAAVESIDTKTEERTISDDCDLETKYVKVKFFSKLQAIAEINKMMGYNAAEKHDLSNKDGTLQSTGLENRSFEELYQLKYGKKP